jgi:hypothetical protein
MKESPKLSRSLFWDTNPDTVNFDKSARYVIEKVVTRGQFEDWQEIKRYYGLEKIKECCLRSRDLDPKALSFLSAIFDIPKEEFRWYTQIQSNPRLYPY